MSRDPIERLVRLAPTDDETVPAATRARVRASMLASWQTTVTRRRRARAWMLACCAVGFLITASVASVWWHSARIVGRVAAPGSSLGASDRDSGLVLHPGQTVETQLEGTVVALEAGPGLRIDSESRVVFASRRRLRLDKGAIFFDSRVPEGEPEAAARPSPSIEIQTELATLTNQGTVYQARMSDGQLEIAIRSGSVRVVPRRGSPFEIRSGELVVLRSSGVTSNDRIAPSDPRWSWSHRLAAPFAIDGRTLGDFLAWFEDESGISFRLSADPAVRSVRLHGDLEFRDPLAAVEPALRLCGLQGEIREGVLVVREVATSSEDEDARAKPPSDDVPEVR